MATIPDDTLEQLSALCREYRVARVDLFGSGATPDFDVNRSDFDFLVEFPPNFDLGPWMRHLTRFEEEVSGLFNRKVDVVMRSARIDNYFQKELERTRIPLYHAPEISEVAQ